MTVFPWYVYLLTFLAIVTVGAVVRILVEVPGHD